MVKNEGVVFVKLGGERIPVRYSGGDGSSIEEAVKIHADSSMIGIGAERAYISKKLGRDHVDWELEIQALIDEEDSYYDSMKVKTKDGEILTYYFDISAFFGRY